MSLSLYVRKSYFSLIITRKFHSSKQYVSFSEIHSWISLYISILFTRKFSQKIHVFSLQVVNGFLSYFWGSRLSLEVSFREKNPFFFQTSKWETPSSLPSSHTFRSKVWDVIYGPRTRRVKPIRFQFWRCLRTFTPRDVWFYKSLTPNPLSVKEFTI